MRKILLLIIAGQSVISANAQWVADPAEGTPVVTTAGKGTSGISAYASTSDGEGGMYIAWIDSRNSATTGDDLFITRLKADGTVAAGFAAGGNVVCNAAGTQSNVEMVPDGSGGVNLVWQDARDNATLSNNIYGVKVKADGTVDGPVNGFLIAGTTLSENSPSITTVATEKVAVVWRYTGTAGTSTDLAINFADFAAKNTVLPAAVVIADKANAQSNQKVVADGAGGALVVWTDARVATTNAHIYGQRISSAGTLLWGPAGTEIDGLQLTNSVGNALLPQAVSDGAGGMVVAFGSTRVATDNANIYAIRVDGSGNNVWTASGVDVCLALSTQSNVRLVKSGNNYLVAWAERRFSTNPPSLSNNIDVYIQSLKPDDGSINWAADGVPVIQQTGNQPNSQTEGLELLDDGAGGAFVIWDDARISTSDLDVFAQHIKPDGTQNWPATGAPVSTKSGSNQNWPRATKSSDGKVMVAWRDSRSTFSSAEIFAALIEPSGVLPVNFLEVSATAQAKQVLVKWTTAQEQKLAEYEVERSSNGVSFTNTGNVKARNSQGVQQYGFTDYTPSSGNNYYRIKSVNLDGTFKFSEIVKVSLPYLSNEKVQLYPNPAVAGIQLQLNDLPAGSYQVRIIDASGRNLENVRLQKVQDSQVFGLQTGKLAQGLYRLQVTNEKGETISVQTLMKK